MSRIIYDFGANAGKNLTYYLQKADLVVAVEPNPELVERLQSDFADEIREERLAIVSAAVTTRHAKSKTTLFVSPGTDSRGSTIEQGFASDWSTIQVPTTSVDSLFDTYGSPYFVKIDIEGHDAAVLGEVLQRNDLPEFIQVETHDPRVLAQLLLSPAYQGFKVIEGKRVNIEFANHRIRGRNGTSWHDFEWHSAGPFGDDLPGEWLDRIGLVVSLGSIGPGWVDIHASASVAGRETKLLDERSMTPEPFASRSEMLRYSVECLAVALGRLPVALLRRQVRATDRPIRDGVLAPLGDAVRTLATPVRLRG